MPVINCYKDSTYTTLFQSIQMPIMAYSSITIPRSSFTVGDKTYKYYSGYGGTHWIKGVQRPQHIPFMTYEIASLPTNHSKLYFKNGLTINECRCSSSTMRLEDYKAGTVSISTTNNNSMINSNNKPILYGAAFDIGGVLYMGFLVIWNSYYAWDSEMVGAAFLAEESFWTDALNPPYGYGTKPDGEGGQGDGKFPHTPVGLSGTPTISLPTGDHGLHAYRINQTAYDSLQSYLWGEGKGLAKSLWDKFVNHKKNPTDCVVACYRLPSVFMPTGTAVSNIKIAGISAPITGSVQSVSLGFDDYYVDFGNVTQHFYSWADYTGVSAKICIPLCGEITAPLEKMYGYNIYARYRIDRSNGNVSALVYAGVSRNSINYILGEVTGNCCYNVPITGGDDGTLARIGAVVSGVKNVISGFEQGAQSFAAMGRSSGMTANDAGTFAAGATSAMTSIGGKAISDMVCPPFTPVVLNYDMSGSLSACTNGRAYVEFIYPQFAYPTNFGSTIGWLARSCSGKVKDFAGLCSFYIALDGWDIDGATEEEKNEIAQYLEGGLWV